MLIFISSITGGAGKSAVAYANILVEIGHNVSVVCGRPRGHDLKSLLDKRVNLVVLSGKRGWALIFQLVSVLRRKRGESAIVIGPSNISTFSFSAILARFEGHVTFRQSNSVTATLALYPFWYSATKRILFSFGIKRAQRVIAVTKALEEELVKEWSVDFGKIVYIPNGVAISEAPLEERSNKQPILLCPARLHRQKDHKTLLHAFAKLQEKRPSLLKLAGEGPELFRLKELATALGITDRVEFLGYVEDVRTFYRAVDVTVLSSRHEGFPNVLVEALAQGCPVVATDCPTGPREIISDDTIGKLASVGDPGSLCAALDEALSTNYDRLVLQERAREFSLNKLEERLVEHFSP